MNKTKIEWCDYTWNPVTGCLHGCSYCYARRIDSRFGDGSFMPAFHPERLQEPTKIKKPSRVFVSSMGDLFGDWVSIDWIKSVFKACEAAPNHLYYFLTKNPIKYGQLNGALYNYSWNTPLNWWFGITITSQGDISKLRYLPYGPARTFISLEPLLGEIDFRFHLPSKTTQCKCSYCGHHTDHFSSYCQHCGKRGGYSGSFRSEPINWVIVGAQTGPGAVKPKPEWIESVIVQCRQAGIPVFIKDNCKWPEKIQEWPEVPHD